MYVNLSRLYFSIYGALLKDSSHEDTFTADSGGNGDAKYQIISVETETGKKVRKPFCSKKMLSLLKRPKIFIHTGI